MENLAQFWNVIVESNTLNFVVFVLILAYLCKKIDVNKIIENLQAKIQQMVEASKEAKEVAIKDLAKAEDSVKNVATEVETILSDAKATASKMSEKIAEDAKLQAESIKKNAKKIIDAEEKIIYNLLMKKASKASLEGAKSHIKDTLRNNEALQDKYINESIDKLDGLNL